MPAPKPVWVSDLDSALSSEASWDAVILVTDRSGSGLKHTLSQRLSAYGEMDDRLGEEALLIPVPGICGGRLIHAPTGPLDRDFDDVRRVRDAANCGATIAMRAGTTRPLLIVDLSSSLPRYRHAIEVAFLGVAHALWQPLEAREALGESSLEPIDELGVFSTEAIDLEWLSALESGRRFARDLCGTEPERMAPVQFAACCEEFFKESGVKLTVHQDADFLRQGYPLLSAVARASTSVSRHRPCVVRLVYEPDGDVKKTLFFAGKGVTYDTGGADIKVGGHMAGMSRDKGGAAAVAGLMAMLARIKPPHVQVVAELGLVRNSIGSDAFVSDEIIKSHAGVRVRICNTDAEGRLVLADLLSHLREEAAVAPDPEVFSVATLTGHAALALGPYTALVENGPARASGIGARLFSAGELWADPAELSSSRREDYEFVRPSSRAEDIFSSNNAPSVSTVRGHQYPMAFLSIASGLEGHGLNSSSPIPYTHMDIAGSCIEPDDWKLGRPTASPIAAIAAAYLRELVIQAESE